MIRKAIIVVLTLAAVGTAAIDVASFRPRPSHDDVDYLFQSDVLFCTSFGGRLMLFRVRCSQCNGSCEHATPRSLVVWRYELLPPVTFRDRRFGQFRWSVYQSSSGRLQILSLPTWAPLVLFAAYPTIAFIRGPLRRWRRRRRGLCVTCGYDLTGNVTGVCSECGEDTPNGERASLDASSGFGR